MSKPKTIQISIPKPCAEKWDEMTPTEQGRFCAHCQKTVIDFTKWSDAALYEFLAQNKTEKMCGRLRMEQVERSIIPHQPQSRLYRLFIGLGLTLVLSQLPTSQTFAWVPYVYEYNPSFSDDSLKNEADSVVIKGIVVDEKNEPMIGAIVFLINNGKTIGGAATDVDGNFSVKLAVDVDLDSCYLDVKYASYKTKSLKLNHKQQVYPAIQLDLSDDVMMLGEMIIQYKNPLIDKWNAGTNRTFTSDEIEKMPH